MTLIMAGCNRKYGYIISDTKETNRLLGTTNDNKKKIYFSNERNSFISGYHSVALCDAFIKLYESNIINTTADVKKCFEKAYNSITPYAFLTKDDLDNSCIINLYLNDQKDVHILYLNHKGNENLEQADLTLYPTDICGKNGISNPQFDIVDDQFNDVYSTIEKHVDKFIQYSKLSDVVSDTCCCAILGNDIGYIYFEKNMYDLKSALHNREAIDSNIKGLIDYQNK